jgi:hypothetical protein
VADLLGRVYVSPANIASRAASITDDQKREHFLSLIAEADRYAAISKEMRQAAWRYFRALVPRRKPIKRTVGRNTYE